MVKDIRRATRRHFSSEDKIRIVLDGLRGEDSIAELQRFVLSQDQEKRKVHQRFDTELAKLRVLWEAYKPVSLPGASAAQPAAPSAAR